MKFFGKIKFINEFSLKNKNFKINFVILNTIIYILITKI